MKEKGREMEENNEGFGIAFVMIILVAFILPSIVLLSVGDEMIDHVNDLFDNGLIIEDIKVLYEDEDTFLLKDII